MGIYKPSRQSNQPSLSDALDQAQGDHYRECPDADFKTRSAAFILDLIFLSLMGSGLDRLVMLALAYINFSFDQTLFQTSITILDSLRIGIEASFLYLYLMQTVQEFGGTPAKLLLDLRVLDAKTGQRLSFSQTLLRETVGKILSLVALGFLWPIFRSDSRTLHDLISRSVVKKVHQDS